MGKKKKKNAEEPTGKVDFDPELMRMYLMGATNPGISNKFESHDEVIDLHLEKIEAGNNNIPAQDALFHQLEKFEQQLDKAIAAGKFELRVIHGLGKGRLKQEIHKILDKHPGVSRYENDYTRRYGFGSTLIILK